MARYASFQPWWYVLWIRRSASGAFFAFKFTGSHSIFFSSR
jgi:hypothetical protein